MRELGELGGLKGNGGARKCVDIVLYANDLYADIANRLALTAESMEAQTDADLHTTKDVLDDGNKEIVNNLVARHVYDCVGCLYPYSKTPIERCKRRREANNEVDAYVIRLTFEHDRSETSIQQLQRLIHDYIVYRCYAEWLAMTVPQAGTYTMWENKAEEIREQITTVLVPPYNAKRLRVRPHWY